MRINKKTIISLILCVGVFFMAVGYSILSTNLKITGGANITSTWDIRITGITNDNASGSAYNLEEPSFTNDTAKFRVALVNPGDSMTYTVTVENKGTITAILNYMNITTSGTDAIIYEVSGLKEGDTLAAGQSKTITVVARYNSNVIADPDERAKTLKVGLEWVQYTNQSITAGTYTINYNANGGTGSMSGTVCSIGSSCTLRTNAFEKEGYGFVGWATSASGALVYTDEQAVTNLTSSGKTVTLYAVWEEANNVTLVQQILANNTAYADNVASPNVTYSTGIDFNNRGGIQYTYTDYGEMVINGTNGLGLYYTSTNTIDGGTTYYFRGNVDNNYVKFGKYTSGIVKYASPSSASNNYYSLEDIYDTVDACTSAGHTDCTARTFASSGDDMYWRIVRINEDGTIRLIYNGTSATSVNDIGERGYSSEATTWYNSHLSSYSSYIAAGKFGGGGTYMPDSSSIAFGCTDGTTSCLSELQVGLITESEIIYAGGAATYSSNSASSPSYLLNHGLNGVGSTYGYGYYLSGGDIYAEVPSAYAKIYPVINLKADVLVGDETQDGTVGNEYTIKTS